MIDLYLFYKLMEPSRENLNKKNKFSIDNNTMQIIFGLIITAIALFIHFDCNKQITFGVISALCCPFCYILYHMVNKHRCKNIITTVNDTVKDTVKDSANISQVESVQLGGNIDSTISSIKFDS
tara:strand:+ start:2089 stop:2460 length:372 start_codon:yes stop_codon:yes gene_type:complete